MDGRGRWIFYACGDHSRPSRLSLRGSGAVRPRQFLERIVAQLVGIDGDNVPADGRDTVDESDRQYRISQQHLETAAHAAADLRHDLFFEARSDPHADGGI